MDQNKTGDVGMTCPEIVTKLSLSLTCLKLAAQKLDLPYKELGDFKDILVIKTKRQDLYFWLNKSPFNDSMVLQIANDKLLQIQLFKELNILFPETYYWLPTKKNLPKSLAEGSWITKPTYGSFSKGVELFHSNSELISYLNEVATHKKLLIQKYITGTEYRVILHKNKIKLVYPKLGNERFSQISSLETYTPPKITDPNVIKLFQPIADQLYQKLNSNFLGADIIVDNKNQPYLIEINANPVCYFYCEFNGKEDFIQIYSELLQEYQN